MVEIQRFLRTAKPEADESFMGYILRLTELNGYESPSWIMRSVGLNYPVTSHSCSFISESSESLRALARLSGRTTSELVQLTYQQVHDCRHCSFFGVSVEKSCIRPAYPKICPECIREAAYYRRAWEFALITVCPIHECMLIDECPNCERRITWARGSVTSCSCKFDWRESSVTSVTEQELKLARIIYYRWGLSCGADALTVAQESPFPKLPLQDFIFAIVFMAGQLHGLSITTIKNLSPRGRNKELHTCITPAYYIFEDWPTYFHQFLHWWRKQERNTSLISQRLKSPLFRDFGKFYPGLYKILSDSKFDFIKQAFVNYLAEEWNGGDGSFAKKKVRESHITSKYVSKTDARRLLEIDDAGINQLIDTAQLKTVVQSKGMKRLIFVDVMDIAKQMREPSER